MVAVPKLWPGETFVCIGGGPSLTAEDVEYCRGKARVIAINDAYKLAPWADVLYACDSRWWKWQEKLNPGGLDRFRGLRYSLTEGSKNYGAHVLRSSGELGLELDPTALKTGRNGGYQGINLAVHLGAARILLLGYDMQLGPSGEHHWFGAHPQGVPLVGIFRRNFAALVDPLRRLGIEIVNCSRRTALETFQRMPITEALPATMEALSS